ncbi:IclR family transcriptional regulator [Blastococcus saxobsidens]|uniref:Putative transcription regulator, IclR family n=1 Tax=Blastococcus saxobsidens (strain DD2) TaxID=1146883 RepID=H6RMC5_BLASD|nr:IclR family transcriptional regulator [Blastococcus saxobsidens]CCG02561.1 Putative transcription regulator, IclR family [Blastococcus saxobsidens DD2]
MDETEGRARPSALLGPVPRGRATAGDDGAKLNQSVRKAITLLRATADDPGANVSSLARAAGLPRATALRMIQTLEQEGFLLRVAGDDRVLIGPELLRLARGSDASLVLLEAARPVLGDLVAAVKETGTLSVVAPDGGLDLVHQVDAPHHLRPQSWVGQRFPLHASASGKVLLATFDDEQLEHFLREPLERLTPSTIATATELRVDLRRVRDRGHALCIDEAEEGLSGVATGIYGPAEELVGVLTVSGPTQRLSGHRATQAADQVGLAAGRIESALQRGRDRARAL